VVRDQAGGLDAIAQARRQIRKGTRLVVSGGIDGSLCPWGWAAQLAGERMSRDTDPATAYRPFDPQASGFVSGEGGAVVVLEPAAEAKARGARIYGEIAGHASTIDPRPGSGREPGLRRAIELALADAGMSASEIDVVFADGAADPTLDRAEADAIADVFGPFGVPVTAPKVMTGRLYCGAGSLDVVTALLAMRDGVIPPTINVTRAADLLIDLVDEARPAALTSALVLGRGYGGFNSALVVRA
jgi:act minimal PKS chain-length factor (CLF/KS beta)